VDGFEVDHKVMDYVCTHLVKRKSAERTFQVCIEYQALLFPSNVAWSLQPPVVFHKNKKPLG
ncbi:MAG TPA: hypothetical protein VF803_03460, partial [Candidatus Paceibacterota bacterium]